MALTFEKKQGPGEEFIGGALGEQENSRCLKKVELVVRVGTEMWP